MHNRAMPDKNTLRHMWCKNDPAAVYLLEFSCVLATLVQLLLKSLVTSVQQPGASRGIIAPHNNCSDGTDPHEKQVQTLTHDCNADCGGTINSYCSSSADSLDVGFHKITILP